MASLSKVTTTFVLLTLCVGGVVVLFTALDSQRRPGKGGAFVADVELGGGEQQLLDLPSFRYLVDSDACEGGTGAAVLGVLLVTSYVGDVEARSALRRAYPRRHLEESLGLRRVFLLAAGGPGAAVSQGAVLDEGRRFGDVVQGDFREAYRNLSYKHVMGLRWAAERCPRARYVIKMDDDVVADLYRLAALLAARPPPAPLLMGYVMRRMRAVREPRSKWYVTRREYPRDLYPDFLSGWLYVTTPPTVARLLKAARAEPYFWIDDTFVTGVLRQRAGLGGDALRDIGPLFTADFGFLECCLQRPRFSCEFAVGPDGGDPGLQVRFQAHAYRCRECPPYSGNRSLSRTCVRKLRDAWPRGAGQGRISRIQLG